MRRNPLALLLVPASFYVYLLIRGLGRALAAALMGLPVDHIMFYKILPAFDVFSQSGEIAPAKIAILILGGPVCALLAGYILLVLLVPWRERLPSGLGLFLCFTCYLSLILDPIYFALIPLLPLGGEPEMLARITSVSPIAIALPAMGLLGLNVILTRNRLVLLIKRS